MFSEESLKDKRNTTAVEVGSSTLIAGHVLEYKPSGMKSFEEVKKEIEQKLKSEKAKEMAVKEGATKLQQLRQNAST